MKAFVDTASVGASVRVAVRVASTFLLVCLVAQVASATAAERPRIGLALGGGGARGAAHIGVIQALADARIPVDCIAGTSIGAVVGALYATGYSPPAMERFVRNIDWQQAFDDSVARADRSIRRKDDEELALLKPGIGISDGSIKLRTGLVLGQNIQLVLSEIAAQFPDQRSFDRLGIPLRIVATDLESGQAVVLRQGDLVSALRASMAVPGALSPVTIDNHLLVDGGVANNLPIDIAREMCADIVIAVDVGAPLAPRESLQSAVDITEQITTILTRANTDVRVRALHADDVLIVPQLGDIGSTDFSHFVDGIASGREAVAKVLPQLQRLVLSEQDYAAHLAARPAPRAQAPVIAFYRIDNQSHVSDERVARALHADDLLGKPLRQEKLNAHFAELYGSDLFETVGYEPIRENGADGIRIHVREKSWGPNYINLRILSDGDLRSDSSISIGVDVQQTAMNRWDAEWRNFVQIGAEQLIFSEWYQPLPSSRWFVAARAQYQDREQGQFDARGDQIAAFDVGERHLDARVGYEVGPDQRLESGVRWGVADITRRVGSGFERSQHADVGELFAQYTLDRLDDRFFPKQGVRSTLQWIAGRESLGAERPLDQFKWDLLAAFGFERTHFLLHTDYERTLRGVPSLARQATLGGFLNLSGVATRGLTGEDAFVVAGTVYQQFDARLLDVYLGVSLEYGNTFTDRNVDFRDGRWAGSVWGGADTPFGPAYLGFGVNEGGDSSVFLRLGRPL